MKRGCISFIIVIAVLAAGAGLSVIIHRKQLKPKARSKMLAQPERTLERIQGEFAPDVDEALERRFELAYKNVVRRMTAGGAQSHPRLSATVENLQRIRSDGKITAEEAKEWINSVSHL